MNDYQQAACKTAIYPGSNAVIYPALGLASEAGEVCGKVKKVLRDNNGVITNTMRQQIADELGDVLWYIATLAADLGVPLQTIADDNIAKLRSRKERGTLTGSGDTR